jgi:hypothetical protein
MTAPAPEFLSRRLRARQSAVRCERQAHVLDLKAARYPVGSGLHTEWAALAADMRATAADWRSILVELDAADEPDEEPACPCGGDHPADEHDSLAALDEDDDRSSDH